MDGKKTLDYRCKNVDRLAFYQRNVESFVMLRAKAWESIPKQLQMNYQQISDLLISSLNIPSLKIFSYFDNHQTPFLLKCWFPSPRGGLFRPGRMKNPGLHSHQLSLIWFPRRNKERGTPQIDHFPRGIVPRSQREPRYRTSMRYDKCGLLSKGKMESYWDRT